MVYFCVVKGLDLTLKAFIFSSFKVGEFVQCDPQHENPFTSDSFLQSYLSRLLPREAEHMIRSDLESFGDRCASEIQVSESEMFLLQDKLIQIFV